MNQFRLPCLGAFVILLGLAPMGRTAELVQRGIYEWSEAGDAFGGFSGLAMEADGGSFLAVSDQGWLFRADLGRDGAGRIRDARTVWQGRFLDNKGVEVTPFQADAEALAVAPDGTVFVGFEAYTRIAAFHPPDMMPAPQHEWDRFKPLWGNEAVEGVAILPDRSLLAVLEEPRDGHYRTLIGRDRDWRDGPDLPAPDGYAASDATVGPDGRLYLLERRLTLTARFVTRIRRFEIVGDDGFGPGETLLETAPGVLDNMEGISLWQDGAGQTVVTLISDDNFLPIQNTLLAEYDLVE